MSKSITNKYLESLSPKEKLYRISIQENLFLEIRPNGKKYWVIRYTNEQGKSTTKTLGMYPYVAIPEARKQALEFISNVKQGLPTGKSSTFDHLFEEWYKANLSRWKDDTAKRKKYIYNTYIKGYLGKYGINEIKGPKIIKCLSDILKRQIPETCNKAKQVINGVFNYAIANGYTRYNPIPAVIAGMGVTISSKNKNYRYISDPKTLKSLLNAIDNYNGDIIVKEALKVALITFVRPYNIRTMQWDEINFDSCEWNIPAEKMKMKRAHIVPLPKQVIQILTKLKPITGDCKYVFSFRTKTRWKIMSDNTLNKAIKSLGFGDKMVSHSVRHTASTFLHEMGWDSIVIERQLSHIDKNTVRGTYNKAEFIETRKEMLQFWADYLYELKESDKPFIKRLSTKFKISEMTEIVYV
ncbi:tyrosine-type recombinase/integrase [Deferribacteraceae bacterium V6Fe1]|nr:tyrosine-type recombinase/integrase [Deferribacteraceae bacterium V6Fe1]